MKLHATLYTVWLIMIVRLVFQTSVSGNFLLAEGCSDQLSTDMISFGGCQLFADIFHEGSGLYFDEQTIENIKVNFKQSHFHAEAYIREKLHAFTVADQFGVQQDAVGTEDIIQYIDVFREFFSGVAFPHN